LRQETDAINARDQDKQMKKVKMLTGHEIPLDGDLLYVLESLYREVTLRRELKVTFEDMMREISHLVEEMDDESRKRYLIESLFLNTVTYENERLGAYMKKLTGKAERSRGKKID
jgi:hypothetical protein